MTTTLNPRVGAIGVIFEVAFRKEDGSALDISSATVLKLYMSKPAGGDAIVKNLTFSSDGIDGLARWITTLTSDLDQAGSWQFQGFCSLPGGYIGPTVINEIQVDRNLY